MNDLPILAESMHRTPSRLRKHLVRNRHTGRMTGSARVSPEQNRPVHLSATIEAAATRSGANRSGFSIEPQDLRTPTRVSSRRRLIVFIVDTSDSMTEGVTTARISVAKGAILALLNRAYVSRDRVSLVTFHDGMAQTVLPPTGSIDIARSKLQKLPVGGSSPLAKGLHRGWEIIRQERQSDPNGKPLIILLSDGDANAPLSRNVDPAKEVRDLGRMIAADNIPAVIIETGSIKPNRLMQNLAEIFATTCYRTTDLKASSIIEMVEATDS